MNNILDFINNLVWLALGVSTLMAVLDMIGFMPKKLKKKLKLNRAEDTLDVLKDMGIDIESYRRKISSINFPKDYSNESLEKIVSEELNKIKMNKKISVGRTRPTKLDYYIDLIGHSCNPDTACGFARYLSTYWSENCNNSTLIANPLFDFVVTPKGGSPILGYEFAKLINKPFVLHELRVRFQDNKDDKRAYLNCAELPEEGSTALIVDDSTTGGAMVIETINNLRKYGYNVSDCLVVFEPQSKDARKKLRDKQVNLVSIVKTHND
ncbi:orotate phosphoribosyltransferase [[Clostridium] sordellii]|uniref:phosphoribosyltransferase n=1 Tax=Paraclostridium sordellii TaxID=1505 RepID=UPI0005DEA79F|nr:phosphoribosyltransferase [Paeniclostridium sordellii]CEN89846.1 orotate phosphoribosyltransferase [[Clostridium] sordellii] [Paeniclostridium sordellii]CEQ10373.1 orotate phosphoribosyltransferase [[Clostridium] sordellii] [Paeniclostridium sordellii]